MKRYLHLDFFFLLQIMKNLIQTGLNHNETYYRTFKNAEEGQAL